MKKDGGKGHKNTDRKTERKTSKQTDTDSYLRYIPVL